MAWERRIKDGLAQYRETGGRWKFRIIGFDSTVEGQAGTCSLEDGNSRPLECPIDARSRVLVAGRRYGRAHWMH